MVILPYCLIIFQSTLPRGSDLFSSVAAAAAWHFNPRSLAGATCFGLYLRSKKNISIHAPSRERLKVFEPWHSMITFQSTLPRGSDNITNKLLLVVFVISIHAPSRERLAEPSRL